MQVASNAADLTEKNFSKLVVESAKLEEHSKRAWRCWMWLMLAIVLILFISKCCYYYLSVLFYYFLLFSDMVLFMKVMKKSK